MNNAVNKAVTKSKQKMKDYCTASPDLNYGDCCKKHDEDYIIGSGVTKFKADWDLAKCIAKKGPIIHKGIAVIYFGFVSAFGSFFYQKEEE